MSDIALIRKARRVAFQGEPGSYSHLAAREALPHCEAVPAPTFEDAFASIVERDLAAKRSLNARAVLGEHPIEYLARARREVIDASMCGKFVRVARLAVRGDIGRRGTG